MDTRKYINYAFISYKREDEKWARWLQKKLESYKLPATMRKESPGLPKYIRPIFRDGTDLSGGILVNQLHNELVRSKFLIVICSPNATMSEWINKEAQTFIDEGRIENIIPFIVDGVPYSDDNTKECFPHALLNIPKEKELLGINVQEVGKNIAFIRLVATMLGIRFDSLWQRHRRILMQKRIAYGAISLFLLLLGMFVWDYNRSTYDYFADWVDSYGVPEGIIPMTDDQVSHRRGCYQFEYRRIPFGEPNAYSWRITKVSYVNSALRPKDITNTELKDRYPIQEIEYNKQTGVVSRINYCDTNGKVLLRHVLSERDGVTAAVADFVDSQEQRGTGFVGADLSSMSLGQMDAGQQKSNIVRYVYERDEKGHIVKQTYHANNDYQLKRSAISDADGIFCRSFTLDSLGRRIKVEYLGLEGKRTCTKKGIAGRIYEYDEYGNICKATYLNFKGNPTLNEELWASTVDISDEWGNIIVEKFFDGEGEPCMTKEGCSKWTAKYDNQGNIIEAVFWGIDGRPCLNNDGCAKWLRKYNDRGNCIEESYWSKDGVLCLNKNGYAKWKSKYDDRGNIIEAAFFGTDGEPCLNNDGYSKLTKKYDDRGNITEETFEGTDGNPCLNNDGYAKCARKYDDRGNIIEAVFGGIDGEPCLNNDGCAKWLRKYDDHGNMIEAAAFDIENKPCFLKYGYAKCARRYDDRGNLIEAVFFGTNSEPCLNNDGFAKYVSKYDDRGNEIEVAFFGTNGEPCLNIVGYAKWISKYDDRGNEIEVAFFGADGELCQNNEGCAKWVMEYDERDNVIEASCYGVDNQQCLNFDGYANLKSKYDDRGNCLEKSFYGTDGNSCLSKDCYAKIVYKYDNRDNMIEQAFYDTKGKLIMCKLNAAKILYTINDRGNVTEYLFVDVNNKACINSFGYAHQVIKYNEKGVAYEVSYFDADSLPTESRGYYREIRTLDKRGNCIMTTYFDKNNNSLGEILYTLQISDVSGIAKYEGVPVGSIILQEGDWIIGEGEEKLHVIHQRIQYSNRTYYYITPEQVIGCLHIERGLAGLTCHPFNVEKKQAEEWLKKLEAWKKEHSNK